MRLLTATTTFDLRDARDARGAAIVMLGAGAVLSLVPGHAGLPCPLCGSTTSVEELFRGHPLGALQANPLGLFAVAAAIALLVRRPRSAIQVPLSVVCAMLFALWLFELHRFALI